MRTSKRAPALGIDPASRRALAVFVACLVLATVSARANCFYGDAPTYDDVEQVQISDCWPTTGEHPCYFASLEEHGGTLIGAYVGARGSPRLGVFDLAVGSDDQKNFADMLAALHTALVFEILPRHKLPVNGVVSGLIDGRHYVLSLYRCETRFTIDVPNSEFYAPSRVDERWSILALALEKSIDGFSWKRRLAPKPGRDFAAIWSMGVSLRYAKP